MQWDDTLRDDGAWQRVRGHIREEWGDLTDDEVDQARGNWDQFAGTVKQKTGESVDAVEHKMREWTAKV